MTHGNGALYRSCGHALACDGEVHVDGGEHLGVFGGALAADLHTAALHVVPTALQDQHHVIGRAAACAREQQLHGAWRQVLTTVFRLGSVGRAVHGHHMAAASFCNKAHA